MNKKQTAIAMVGVAAVLLLFAALTKSWFQLERRHFLGNMTVSTGLLGAEACGTTEEEGERCDDASLGEMAASVSGEGAGRYKAFAWFGRFTFGLALLSGLALGALAFFALRKPERAPLVAKLALLACTLAVLCGLIYVINKPTFIGNAAYGTFAFLVGGLLAVAGAALLARADTYNEVARDPSIPRL